MPYVLVNVALVTRRLNNGCVVKPKLIGVERQPPLWCQVKIGTKTDKQDAGVYKVCLAKRLGQADGAGFLKNGYSHIFVVPSEGGTPRQLTEGDYQHGGQLTWSPDVSRWCNLLINT